MLSGVQYAMERYPRGFIVTDGHHNRVLRVRLDGSISELRAFGDIVATGLARQGKTIYMAEAGPVPHLPENGKVVAFTAKPSTVTTVAVGGRLLVDVEFGRGQSLFALAHFTPGHDPGSPADPDTGQLLEADAHGRSGAGHRRGSGIWWARGDTRPGPVAVLNAGSPTVMKELDRHDLEVIQVDFSESHRFAIAGLHCATLELVRDQADDD